jgi:hypothetical protein
MIQVLDFGQYSNRIDKCLLNDKYFLLKPLNEMERHFDKDLRFLSLLKEVSPDKSVRDAAHEAVTELSKFAIEIK